MNDRPNIVIITPDQWRGDCIGMYKSRHPVMTPHVDQLGCEGTIFSHAYAGCPVCMPQRATFLTGKSGSRLGKTCNFEERTPIKTEESLAYILTKEANYQTKAVGKMHFVPDRSRFGFQHITLHPNDYVNWLEKEGYGGYYRGHGLGGNEVYPTVSAVPERYTHTHWIVDQSIEFLGQKDPDTPFFLWMIFEAPHSPYDPPEPFDRMYDNFDIPDPLVSDWQDTSTEPLDFIEKKLTYKYGNITPQIAKETRRKYYGQVSYIDYQLGRFLGELKAKGLYDNTMIIFTSDHGDNIGDYGLYGKSNFLNGSCHIPFIIKPPKNSSKIVSGAIDDNPVLTEDIFPTILDFAGIEFPHDIDGKSLCIDKSELQPRIICGEYDSQTAFATDGYYKYIYYRKNGTEQLFDLENDWDEVHDLSTEEQLKAHKDILKDQLRQHLSKHNSSMIKQEDFVSDEYDIDELACKNKNPFAWRGPMRHGQGYNGGFK